MSPPRRRRQRRRFNVRGRSRVTGPEGVGTSPRKLRESVAPRRRCCGRIERASLAPPWQAQGQGHRVGSGDSPVSRGGRHGEQLGAPPVGARRQLLASPRGSACPGRTPVRAAPEGRNNPRLWPDQYAAPAGVGAGSLWLATLRPRHP